MLGLQPQNPPERLLTDSPYKGPAAFTEKDAGSFYGRQAQCRGFVSLIRHHRLAHLYGASGTGKTSLLQAAVIPELERDQPNVKAFYIRVFEHPTLAVRRVMDRHLEALGLSSAMQLAMSRLKPASVADDEVIKQVLTDLFSTDDIKNLCYDLGVDYEQLSLDNKAGLIREFLLYMRRESRLPELRAAIEERRPTAFERLRAARSAAVAPLEAPPLYDYLAAAARLLNSTLIIVLDQFEEFFTARFTPQDRIEFAQQLALIESADDVPLRVALSIREDRWACLSELEPYVPDIYVHRQRLEALTAAEAREAIEEPVKPLGMRYDETLTAQLLQDLMGQGGATVAPPQLQIVCGALYNAAAAEGRKVVVWNDYEALGRTQGILGNYLRDELRHLPPGERLLADGLLESLVTSEATRRVAGRSQLAAELGTTETALEPVLSRLVNYRLLTTVEQGGQELGYELVHDYLIQHISVTPDIQRRKQVEDIVRRAVGPWKQLGTVLGDDILPLVYELRGSLRLGMDEQALVRRSAARYARRLRFERIAQYIAVGFIAGSGSGALTGLVTALLQHQRALQDILNFMVSRSAFIALLGAGIACGIAVGRSVSPHAWATLVFGAFFGALSGMVVSLTILYVGNRQSLVGLLALGCLSGALLGLGVGVSSVLVLRFGMLGLVGGLLNAALIGWGVGAVEMRALRQLALTDSSIRFLPLTTAVECISLAAAIGAVSKVLVSDHWLEQLRDQDWSARVRPASKYAQVPLNIESTPTST